jgi:hypothetical protein
MSGHGEIEMQRNLRALRGSVAAALFGVTCCAAGRTCRDAAFVHEQFSAIETDALACQSATFAE